jgi:formate hydrogenlyase subunit 3/multisubunit Na+/H+ antiporter MnhD subunit
VLFAFLAFALPWRGFFPAAQLAMLALVAHLWVLGTDFDLTAALYNPMPGVPLQLRIDRLALLFATLALAIGFVATAGDLGSPRRRTSRSRAMLLIAQASLMVTLFAGSLTALALGWAGLFIATALAMTMPQVQPARSRATLAFVAWGGVGAILLLTGAAAAEAGAGTASLESIPAAAIGATNYLLIVAAPVLALLGLPLLLRGMKDPITAAVGLCAITIPASVYIMLRAVDLTEGQQPAHWVATGLVAAGAAAALASAVSSLWAVDLGARAMRLLQAHAALVVVAFGLGGSLGYGAVIVLTINLATGAAVLLAFLAAYNARLPRWSAGTSWQAAAAATGTWLTVAWVGGLPVGFATTARILLTRAALGADWPRLVLALPALLALLVMAFSAVVSLTIQDGAHARRALPVGALILPVTILVAISLLGTAFLVPPLLPMVADATRIDTVGLRSAVQLALPATLVMATAGAMLALAAIVLPWLGKWTAGWEPRPIFFFPPRASVLPLIWARRLAFRPDVGRESAGRTRLALLGWAAAVLVAGFLVYR